LPWRETEIGVNVVDRLDRRRQLRELEDTALREGRIPPGQSLTVKWPLLHYGSIPEIDPIEWRLRFWGLVHEPAAVTWDQFQMLPSTENTSDIHCVTHWTKLDNHWRGVPARHILSKVQLLPSARYVLVHAPGYTANLPLEALLDDDVLFATEHDGEKLSIEHGGPVRLVVPKRYFWKSVKWVNGIELLAEDRPGFWETRGYHNQGDPWTEERFDDS